ncbi:TPA_asm: polyprotein [Holcus virus 1]|uniref:Replicase n=1 Tax=Holcus virus 1 TaxID=2984270 RepID=A0A9N6YJD6_9RHAB|nr:TPA_asm: polyprotein [Holcus virus 1]
MPCYDEVGCDWDEGDEFEIEDEGALNDMHLASAINLDQLKELMMPGSVQYRIDIPHYLREEYDKIKMIAEQSNSTMVLGMLEPTLVFSAPGGEVAKLDLPSYKEISSLVSKALKARDIYIPISSNSITECLPDVLVYYSWGLVFAELLKMICTRAEVARGGTNPVYEGTEVEYGTAHSSFELHGNWYQLAAHKNFTTLYDNTKKTLYVGNIHSLLLMMDTLGQRICLMVSNQISRLYDTPGWIDQGFLDRVLKIGDRMLERMGNEGYDAIAMFESLVIGKILKGSPDSVTKCNEFLHNCVLELEEMIPARHRTRIMDLVQHWLFVFDDATVAQLSNTFCLYRCWGHPVVDIYGGMAKVHRIGTEIKDVSPNVAKDILCQFRKTFIMNYYAENHMYPPVKISEEYERSYVSECITKGTKIDDHYISYYTSDFLGVEIQKIWDVPITYDLCHILNDKAVTPNQDELVTSVQKYGNTTGGGNRRGLMRWLRGKSINCKDFLTEIDTNGLSENDCIIGMYEKEREIKIQARMFSLMSEKMRYYFVLTEDLMARHILPLFPDITMKDTLNVLQKKFWTIGGMGKDSSLDVNVNIDFSKWNLNMRDELTNPLFRQIDMIFGFKNCIARTHEIFKRCYVYSSSGKYVPHVEGGRLVDDPPMAYRGHQGGFEGLRQKGWTIATVNALTSIAERENIKIRLMGQGDNQIVRILMPTQRWNNNELTRDQMISNAIYIKDNFISDMDRTFDRACLPIKVRETWTSTRLFMYGKMILHDGRAMPQWFKKILRSYALTNEGQVTVSGVIGTIATNMASAAGLSEMPDVMYVIFIAMAEWSLNYLLEYHPFTRQCILKEHEYIVKIPGRKYSRDVPRVRSVNKKLLVATMILIPTAAGGSVTIPLTGFIMRGFPDHASEAYAWIKMLKSIEGPYQRMLENWYSFMGNSTIESDMLIQSPASINFEKPPTPGLQGRDLVREFLLSGEFSANQFMKEAGTILGSFDRKAVCKAMMTDPMNPYVTSEIYSTYAHVYIDGVIRRVENTGTIKKIAQKNAITTQIIRTMMGNEHNYIMYLCWRPSVFGTVFSKCATEHTRQCRDVGWGRTITGVTTPHPLELSLGNQCQGINYNCPTSDYIYVRIDTRGEFVPYLGSRIKNKVISDQDSDARREPLIASGSRICRYASWLGIGPNLMEIVHKNVETVCDISVYNKFIDDDPKGQMSSGSIDHRFNPAGASEGVFINYAPQVGSSVYMSSDCMPKYGRGQTNYTLHFQACYCWFQYISARRYENTFMHYHIECQNCVVPTHDGIKDLDYPFPLFNKIYAPSITDSINRALGYIDRKGNLDIMSDTQVLCIKREPGEFNVNQLQKGVTWSLAIKIGYNIMYGRGTGTDDARIEDLQEYPRIYSYKLYRDLLLHYVAHVIIMLSAVDMNKVPYTEELSKVRRKAIDRVIKTPVMDFKGLAGLTLGRVDYDQDNGHLFMTGSYPETVVSVLRSVKTALIETIGQVGRFCIEDLGKLPIPRGSLSNRQFRFLIMFRCFVEEKCVYYMNQFKNIPEELNSHPKCAHNCVVKALVKTPVLEMSLDRMVKSVDTIKDQKLLPIPLWDNLMIQIHPVVCNMGTPGSILVGNRKIVDQDARNIHRPITLPTASIYKWAGVLNHYEMKRHIIVLGDGTGGTSLLAKTLSPGSTVYPCSLLETHKIIPQDLSCLMPQMSRGYNGISNRVLLNVPDNIMDPDWIVKMNGEIISMGVHQTTMLCDIEAMNSLDLLKIMRRLPKSMQIIIKVYAKDILQDPTDVMGLNNVEVCHNMHLNHHNYELFLSGDIHPSSFPSPEGLFHTIIKIYGTKVAIDDRIMTREIDMISETFNMVRSTSVSLSLAMINNLGVAFSLETLQMPGLEIWAYTMQHIDKHYIARGQSIFGHDKRTMTKAVTRFVTRAALIILGIIVSPSYIKEDKNWGLKVIGDSGSKGIKMVLAQNVMGIKVKLTRKDLQASECLHHLWVNKMNGSPLHHPDPPNDDWLETAVRIRSFTSSLSEFSSHDYIDVFETV